MSEKKNSCISPRIYNPVYILSCVYMYLFITVPSQSYAHSFTSEQLQELFETRDNCIARQQQLPVKVHFSYTLVRREIK